ncbi:CCCH zinc finger [Glarea lozoyensis ATCC 20868]|uniref:CCCH zinc finger n=1 Tax=Glarea lozoyensis (strain ATCC 20868 / MF5171) TaxID=1116229 RepID=S3DXF6_GLAL2|nr:CCCH zinc finger [Glarea lozoyensis ATCC 20868]EPE36626.1 CCCH zinc finger [Glarea lozoyensis ATCC 20868]
MASEDQDILARIGQLAGQINRHKNNQGPDSQPTYSPSARSSPYPSKSLNPRLQTTSHAGKDYSQRSAGWSARGSYSGRGYRGGKPAAPHRNRSLVLNGATASPATRDNPVDTQHSENTPPLVTNNNPSWVTKKDRHFQLINTSVYEKESQNRTKAIEETRKQKAIERDAREKAKFNRHIQRIASHSALNASHSVRPASSHSSNSYELTVQGVKFLVQKDGSKLVKVSGEAKSTPKTAVIAGTKFHRSKNGNMYRAGIIKAYRKNATIKKINEPCKVFSTTGSCNKGPRCRYIHDPSKTAACKEFLQTGSCPSGESCDLSHELTPERTATCVHFAKGNCSNPNCRYIHARVSPAAPVCRAFGIYGYCEKGAHCEERHVHECPDFSNTGTCTTKGCKLPHRYKASVMRSNTNRGEASGDDESSDLSSDDDDAAIDSDDVDSDDMEEYFGNEEAPDLEAMQQDYVQLS